MLSKLDVIHNFATNLEIIRTSLGFSQSEMAEKLCMSLSAYKRIIGEQTEKIDLYVVYLLHELTDKYFFELIDCQDRVSHVVPKLRKLSDSQLSFVNSIIDFEIAFQPHSERTDYITVLNLSGDMYDGMIYDSSSTEKVNAAAYRKLFGNDLTCGIRISSHHLSPVYNYGDIILVGCRPIRDGDVGIFIHKETNRAYIRKLNRSTNSLEPLNSFGESFSLDVCSADMNDWILYGRVLAKMR